MAITKTVFLSKQEELCALNEVLVPIIARWCAENNRTFDVLINAEELSLKITIPNVITG